MSGGPSGTRRATASVVGGNINFGPSTTAAKSRAVLMTIPLYELLLPSIFMGLVMVGVFVAV